MKILLLLLILIIGFMGYYYSYLSIPIMKHNGVDEWMKERSHPKEEYTNYITEITENRSNGGYIEELQEWTIFEESTTGYKETELPVAEDVIISPFKIKTSPPLGPPDLGGASPQGAPPGPGGGS